MDKVEEFRRKVYAEFDSMGDKDVAREIAYAKSHNSQFIALNYLSDRPDRKEKIQKILDEHDKSEGLLLEEDF